MKNKRGDIIYVGKAKQLRDRVKTYFDQSAKFTKTKALISHIHDFDFVLTSNEVESLILENNLIKEHAPKYNIRLRDDKTYPYIQINKNENYPRLVYTRNPKRKKGFKTFGPFPEGCQVRSVLRTLTKILQLRDCSSYEFRSRKTPCLLHQMHQCTAPCVSYVSKDEYNAQVKEAESFLNGQLGIKKIIKKVTAQMNQHSDNEEYERAIIYRDALDVFQNFASVYETQQVESNNQNQVDTDILGLHFGENEIDLSVYKIRNSLMIGHKNINFINPYESESDFITDISTILFQYYSEQLDLPKEVYLDLTSESIEELNLYLGDSLEQKIEFKNKKKKWNELLDTAKNHAMESQRIRLENKNNLYQALFQLKKVLDLNEVPRKLECYDVAIWQGKNPTAAQIVFQDGKPDKKQYRYYGLETRPEGNNDFAMMEEVLSRRLKSGQLPDVFIVDGGKAQVGSFLKILKQHDVEVPVVGIAKSKISMQARFKDLEITKSEERLMIPGRVNPHILAKTPELLRLIVSMRDEAHRFSRKLHHKREKKDLLTTSLDEIPGLGQKTVEKILKQKDFPISSVEQMSETELIEKLGLSKDKAKIIAEYYTTKA